MASLVRRGIWLVVLPALALGAILSMSPDLIERMIFQPSPGVDLRLDDLGVDGEEVFFPSQDGTRIHCFYLPAERASRAILFLHGNAGNASHRLPNAVELMRLGTNVLLLDYRGYGLSEGSPTEQGVYADARSALEYLISQRGIAQERIVLFGRSLGGAVAVELAMDRPLAGVILESTFNSIAAMGRAQLGAGLGALVKPITRARFDSEARIVKLRAPLLFFHGDRDTLVPIELGRQLYEAAPEPKSFEVITGAGHNDTILVGGRPYFERIARFLDKVAPQQRIGLATTPDP